MQLTIQRNRKSPVGILRDSYYKDGQRIYRDYARLTGLDYETLKMLQAKIQSTNVSKSDNLLESTLGKEYGTSYSLFCLAQKIGLDKILDKEQWSKSAMAMIIGRIVFAGSKLSLSNIDQISSISV